MDRLPLPTLTILNTVAPDKSCCRLMCPRLFSSVSFIAVIDYEPHLSTTVDILRKETNGLNLYLFPLLARGQALGIG